MLKTVGNPSTRYGDQTIVDGSLVLATAGEGVDFSANSHYPGMTSELLNDYEEGNWTPSSVNNGANLSALSWTEGKYVKVGRQVTINGTFAATVTASGALTYAIISAAPFAPNITAIGSAVANNNIHVGVAQVVITTSVVYIFFPTASSITSGAEVFNFSITYQV
jgi:hypothetical protein